MKHSFTLFLVLFYYLGFAQMQPNTIFIPLHELNKSIKIPVNYNFDGCIQSYFKVSLQNIGIKNEKNFYKKYHPVVHVELTIGTRKIVKVLGGVKGGTNEDMVYFNNEIISDFEPYRNENVTIWIKLYAIKKGDKIKETIDLISTVCELYPNDILKFGGSVNTIYDKVDKLLSGNELRINYKKTFNSNDISSHSLNLNTLMPGLFILTDNDVYLNNGDVVINDNQIKLNDKLITQNNMNFAVVNFEKAIMVNRTDKIYFSMFKELEFDYDNDNSAFVFNSLFRNIFPLINKDTSLTEYEKENIKQTFLKDLNAKCKNFYNDKCQTRDINLAICLKEPERFAYGNIEDMDEDSSERIKKQIKKEENEREELSNNLKMYATYLIDNYIIDESSIQYLKAEEIQSLYLESLNKKSE